MRTTLALTAALLLALPFPVEAQDARATLAEAARALGADGWTRSGPEALTLLTPTA